jgi:uncharacterized protein YvpB
MIAVERPPVEDPAEAPRAPIHPRPSRLGWPRRLSAVLLVACIVASLGGGGLVDVGAAYSLQGRAEALVERWTWMVGNGIPESDLAPLKREWTQSQASRLFGAGAMFWLPGGADAVTRWERASDAIWANDLSRYRSDAQVAEQALHNALAPELHAARRTRLDAFASATTPLDFSTLRDDWLAEARLVPVDRRIATQVEVVGGQVQRANQLGIRSEPANNLIVQAAAYAALLPYERLARAEMLTRRVIALQANLQGRIDAATMTVQGFKKANGEIGLAQLYGLDTTSLTARVATDQAQYGVAMTPAAFNTITEDLKQVAATADKQVYVALSQIHVIPGVAFYYQVHPLSCEEAATSMALTHQGIYLSQDQILAQMGADLRPQYRDANGVLRWGNPYVSFVGHVNGTENVTGWGANYAPLVRVAKAHGANVIAYGSMSAATIYARLIAGHPVVVYVTWDWAWHPRHDYLSFDGRWIPFIGPADSHVVTAVGVRPNAVLVNDPLRGQYWVSKQSFEAAYSDFGEAIVFA